MSLAVLCKPLLCYFRNQGEFKGTGYKLQPAGHGRRLCTELPYGATLTGGTNRICVSSGSLKVKVGDKTVSALFLPIHQVFRPSNSRALEIRPGDFQYQTAGFRSNIRCSG